MFLFDTERTGRVPHIFPQANATPAQVWERKLPQIPIQGAESSCVLDGLGSIYFGCHDGCVYCLDKDGNVKWQFVTKNKVYSSPVLHLDKLFFCVNKAGVICLSTDGQLLWSLDAQKEKPKSFGKKIAATLGYALSALMYDYTFPVHKRPFKLEGIVAWCSPNILSGKYIVASLLRIGLVALDCNTGEIKWRLDLGLPFNHLASAAITKTGNGEEFIAVVSQSNALYWVNAGGQVVWKKSLVFLANSWGTPCIDAENKHIYCSTSKKNSSSWIFKFDFNGNCLWKTKLKGGMRGGITLSHLDYIIIPGYLGYLYLMDKQTGKVLKSLKVASRMWTSAAVDLSNNIYLNVASNLTSGALLKLDKNGDITWRFDYGKALSVPVIDKDGYIYTASWDGRFVKLKPVA